MTTQTMGGIRYRFEGHPPRAIVVCPKCGQEGRLGWQRRSTGRVRYTVRHENRSCGFGWTSPEWEALDAIHRKVVAMMPAEEGEGYTLRWYGGIFSIIVRCPRCGREGRLIRWRKDDERGLGVRHADRTCYIMSTHPAHPGLWELYREVRGLKC